MSKRLIALLSVLLLLALAGCNARSGGPSTPVTPDPASSAATSTPRQTSRNVPMPIPIDREKLLEDATALGVGWLDLNRPVVVSAPAPYASPVVNAKAPPYQVAADLSNIANLGQFGGFTAEQQRLLATNGFFGAPTDFIQPFFLYENNTYLDVPSFVTTDSVLHTYHLFFDWSMRGVEYFRLLPDLASLTQVMLENASDTYSRASSPNVKQAALDATVYFGVAAKLLELPVAAPEAAAPLIDREVARITAHSGREQLTFLPYNIDYTAFVPRGHYTRTERFAQYFRAMTWFGTVPFPLPEKGQEPGPGEIRAARAALTIANLLGPDELKLWQNVYETTALFVGLADDITPVQYRAMAGEDLISGLESDVVVRGFVKEAVAKLPAPGIRQQLAGIPTGPQMRFMGQRFVLDSAVLQELVKWPVRPVPTGLDVAAAWGSQRATHLLLNERKEEERWDEYPAKLQEQTARIAAVPQAEWQGNLYRGWLWTFQPLLTKKAEGYPWFMQSTAWQDKSINTVLGSWTQLRHDTILYVKPSAAECGGDDQIPPPPSGYVEPDPEFYARLEWLLRSTLAELSARTMVDESMQQQYTTFASLMEGMKAISLKELAGEPLTRGEQDTIRFFGANLERVSIRALGGYKGWWELSSEVDREMALVADVHVSGDSVLEEAVGRPNAIFVAFPADGKVWLGRGAIYSQYEFLHLAADRMTDEAWLKQVQLHETPAPPAWTDSFLTGEKTKVVEPEVKVVVPCGGGGSGYADPG